MQFGTVKIILESSSQGLNIFISLLSALDIIKKFSPFQTTAAKGKDFLPAGKGIFKVLLFIVIYLSVFII